MTKRLLGTTIILIACGPHSRAAWPTPKTLLLCFTLQVTNTDRKLQLPRALNLGTAKRGDAQAQVGRLVPPGHDELALWHFTTPDSITIDVVPASSGVTVMSGVRLYASITDSLVTGNALFWTDEIGGETITPFTGRLVPCPAGA
jgi:hypothetical protein